MTSAIPWLERPLGHQLQHYFSSRSAGCCIRLASLVQEAARCGDVGTQVSRQVTCVQ